MSDTIVVLLGLLAWALIVGPLSLWWCLPDHLEVRELKRRSATRRPWFATTRSGTTVRDRYRHRTDIRLVAETRRLRYCCAKPSGCSTRRR
jgi:hypothetical protein